MLSRPERSESQPRTKNGQPQYSTAGIAISNCSHCLADADRKGRRSMPKTWLPMSRASSASDSGTATGQPPGEIDQLRVVGDLRRHAHRLERHAADRAVAWPFLHDLRMHRAGVERALRQRLCLALLGQIALGVRGEFGAAAGRAEIIGLAAMLEARPARADVDLHAAYGVGGHVRGAFGHLGCVVVHADGLFQGGNSIV